jgi:hypothetical protein
MDASPIDHQAEVAIVAPGEAREQRCGGTGSLLHRRARECLNELDTDRPHRTDTPSTVEPGYFQSEVGVLAYEAPTADAGGTLHFVDLLLKLGLHERVDVQVGYAPVTLRHRGDRAGWLGATDAITGRTLYLRSKLRLFGLGDSPIGFTVAPLVSIPLHRNELVEGGGTLLFGAELTQRLSWELNGSVFFERQEQSSRRVLHFVPCTALTLRVVGPLKVFGELYLERPLGSGVNHVWTGTVDSGVLWLISNDVQADAAVYVGTNAQVPRYTAALGFSFRL